VQGLIGPPMLSACPTPVRPVCHHSNGYRRSLFWKGKWKPTKANPLSGHGHRLEFTLTGRDGPDDPGERFLAMAALLWPRERWTFRAQARSLSGGLLLTSAARSTAPPWVRSIRR